MDKHAIFAWVANRLLNLRNRHFFFFDALFLLLTPSLALTLRLDGLSSLSTYLPALLFYTFYALILRLAIFRWLDFYGRYWRYASINELTQLVRGVLLATVAVAALFFVLRMPVLAICQALPAACGLPRSIPFIDALLALLAVAGSRFSVRLAAAWLSQQRFGGPTQRVLIMGAGDAGAMIAKEIRANPFLGLEPVGFVDDDTHKHDVRIHGLPVLGNRHDIPQIVREHRIRQVIIAMPTAPGKIIRDVVAICEQAEVPAKTIPGIYELLDNRVSINQLRDIDIEDLLRRDEIKIDIEAVRVHFRGKRVLITGGGGSIGSELCRQIWRCAPSQLVILGHGENSVFEIYNELKSYSAKQRERVKKRISSDGPLLPEPSALLPVIADIRFPQRLQAIFEQLRPEIVFHAAAHKHVPLMEENPVEAVTNNILGTRSVLQAARSVGVEHFVMISTDKAVNPTSIMGASKRVAELLVHQEARRSGKPYVAVRFGNVLGSRGSVVLTFKKQIAAGGPVTITHPDMRRYFMTIPEAVQLVLQAGVMGAGGEVFVLDMGQPVKIVDLARDLIELSGLEVGRDIDIEFVGLRAGEKLFEELFVEGETYGRTHHEKIFLASNASSFVPDRLDEAVEALDAAAQRGDSAAIIQGLRALLPEFRPDARTERPMDADIGGLLGGKSPAGHRDGWQQSGMAKPAAI